MRRTPSFRAVLGLPSALASVVVSLLVCSAAAGQEEAPDNPPPAFQTTQDSAAVAQLRALFDRIEEMRQVEVEVEGGVAVLRGRALTPEARSNAVELARGRPGVLYVDDRLEVETSVLARARPVLSRLGDQLLTWVASLPLLLVAILVLVGFGVLARLVGRWSWPYRRMVDTPFVEDLVRRFVVLLVWLVGLLLALELLDATALVGAVLGAAGVAGIALGFAFRNVAENWLAGVLLGLRRPFAPDDQVSVDGHTGRVIRLTHSDTVLMTPAGNHLRIPNARVFGGVVENFTRNPLRRFTLRFTMPRDVSVPKAREALLKGVAGTSGVLEDPGPDALVAEVGDSHLTIEIHAWIDQRKTGFGPGRSLAYRRAKEALEEMGIPGPFSEHTVYTAPPDSPGSATSRSGEAAPADETTVDALEERPETDSALDEQVAEDRARSEETDLLDR